MKIYFSSAAAHLAEKVNIEKGKILIKKFPNGETYLRITNIPENCFLVQSTKTDSDIVEMILALDAFNDYEIKPNLIIPYFGYSKQDKRHQEGEAISAKAFAKVFSGNAGKIFMVDPHIFRGEGPFEYFGMKMEAVSAVPLLAEHAKKFVSNPIILAPDLNASKHAQVFAQSFGTESAAFEKKRGEKIIEGKIYEDRIASVSGEVFCEGRDVLIVDDMIVTGGTIVKAIKKLREQKPNKIIVAAVHGAFANGALEKILAAGCQKVFTTDTIKNLSAEVSVGQLIERIVKDFAYR